VAKLIEQVIIVKLSKLARDSDPEAKFDDSAFIENLEALITELQGPEVMVEITVA